MYQWLNNYETFLKWANEHGYKTNNNSLRAINNDELPFIPMATQRIFQDPDWGTDTVCGEIDFTELNDEIATGTLISSGYEPVATPVRILYYSAITFNLGSKFTVYITFIA